LPKLIGLQQAKRLVLLADMIDAAEAHELALVTWARDADEIDAFVDTLAARLAAGPPFALAQSKALLNDGATATFAQALGNEARAQPGNFATSDSGEAYAAFAAKREPEFTGDWAVPAPRGQERSDPGGNPAGSTIDKEQK
jgi:2-(1,2-epoxy-1,2-dihydrophenyl)acetyl-CoA isomerase